jgi:hypothetical protein
MRPSFVLPAAIGLSLLVSCSDSPEPNDPSGYDPNQGYGAQPGYGQPGQPGYGQPGQPGYGEPQPQPTAPAPAPTATAQGTSATPIAPAAAAAAQPILTAIAAKETAGMQPDGAAFAGQFSEGQTLEQPFQIQPGRCYTVVGVGIGITELDVQIVLHQPPLPAYTAAQDQASGPQAILGGGGNCFKNPLPVGGPAKVVVKATGGNGIAMAQLYSK